VFSRPLINDEPIRCGDGWYYLLDTLCRRLQHILEERTPEEQSLYRASQVKEKFGELRFYLHRHPPEYLHPLNREIAGAEWASALFCDVCGKPGRSRSGNGVERPMLVRTRCDEHVNWFGRDGLAHP
jgi:hypothetical protein